MGRRNKDSVLEKPLDIYQKFFNNGFPPKYEEIKFSRERKKAIIEHIGKRALIKDFSHGEDHYEGIINFDEKYSDVYFLVDGEKIMRFAVNDLERLIVRNPFFKFQDA